MKRLKFYLLFFASIVLLISALKSYGCYAQPIVLDKPIHPKTISEKLPFKLGERFIYRIDFNGIYVGRIEWEYLGRLNIDNRLVDVINLLSDVKILRLFSIQSREKLYIESDTHLPLKVERKVKFLGKPEEILEEYNQKDGFVKITKLDAKTKEEKKLEVKAPIHNIIALLYFFPQDIKLNLGNNFSFNLPTQEINIKVRALEVLDSSKGTYEVYVLEGRPQKFKVWLEKDKRIPLRMEFPVFLGKVTISLDDEKKSKWRFTED